MPQFFDTFFFQVQNGSKGYRNPHLYRTLEIIVEVYFYRKYCAYNLLIDKFYYRWPI